MTENTQVAESARSLVNATHSLQFDDVPAPGPALCVLTAAINSAPQEADERWIPLGLIQTSSHHIVGAEPDAIARHSQEGDLFAERVAEAAHRLVGRRPFDPAAAIAWAILSYPGLAVDGLVTPRPKAMRIARSAAVGPRRIDALVTLATLYSEQWRDPGPYKDAIAAMSGAWSFLKQMAHAVAFAGRVVEWIILAPGRFVRQALRMAFARIAGTNLVRAGFRELDSDELFPLPPARRAAYVEAGGMMMTWMLGSSRSSR